jgi:hypothetical protein
MRLDAAPFSEKAARIMTKNSRPKTKRPASPSAAKATRSAGSGANAPARAPSPEVVASKVVEAVVDQVAAVFKAEA